MSTNIIDIINDDMNREEVLENDIDFLNSIADRGKWLYFELKSIKEQENEWANDYILVEN